MARPLGIGICEEKNLPVKWSATENAKWRAELSERGNSAPIVNHGELFIRTHKALLGIGPRN